MTNRYYLLLASIQEADRYIVILFGAALLAIGGYIVLGWLPQIAVRPARRVWLAFVLAFDIFVTVYSWLL